MPRVQVTLEVADGQAIGKIKDFGRAVTDTFSAVKAGDPALRSATARVQELTTAKGRAATVANQWTGALNLIPGPLGNVASQATSLATALTGPAGVVAAMAATAVAGVGLMKSLSDDIERLDNMSRQTGLAISSLQAFEHAARQAGEAPETLIQGLGRVNTAINDVLTGAPNAGKAFEAIGVDLRRLVKDGASTEQILEATAVALAAIPDPTARAAAQMELFGTRGRAMSTVLDTIAQKSLPGYVTELKEAGIVTSAETNRMAMEFDKMWDRAMQRGEGFITWLKAEFITELFRAQEVIRLIQEDWKLLFSTTELNRRVDEAMAQRFAEERPPGFQGRQGARDPRADPAESAARQKAIEAESKAWGDYADQILELDELLLKFDADAAKAREAAAEGSRALEMSREWRAMEEALKDGKQALDAWTPSLEQGLDAVRETNRAVDGAVGEFQQWGEVTEGFQGILANVAGELDGLPFSIMAVRTQADRDFIRMRDVVDGASGSVERLAQQVRNDLPSAFEKFRVGFDIATQDLTARFQDWTTLGAHTAEDLHTAFSDSFFSVMTGDLDDLDDIWKSFLESILRHITDFLAAEAVNQLLAFVRDLGNFSSATPAGGSAGGGGGIGVDDIIKIAGTAVDIFGGGAGGGGGSIPGLEIFQRKQGEPVPVRVVNIAQAPNMAAGARAGATGGAAFGPAGIAVGAILGGAIGAIQDAIERDFIASVAAARAAFGRHSHAVDDATAAIDDATNATAAFNAASRASVDAFNAMSIASDSMSRQAGQTSIDLFGVQDAMDKLSAASAGATTSTDQTTAGLHGFRDALDAYAAAMGAAVETASAAAAAAAGAASDAAQSAADAHAGFGGTGTPGGGPSNTVGNFPGGGGPGSSGGAGGFDTGGAPGSSDRQFGLLEGPVPGRRGAARWMRLHGGEVVATPEQATALLQAIQGGISGKTGAAMLAELKRQTQVLEQAMRRSGRNGGATVV